jgi:hypothetical protein
MSKPTQYTAAGYHAKFILGGNASLNRLLRYVRMLNKDSDRPLRALAQFRALRRGRAGRRARTAGRALNA